MINNIVEFEEANEPLVVNFNVREYDCNILNDSYNRAPEEIVDEITSKKIFLESVQAQLEYRIRNVSNSLERLRKSWDSKIKREKSSMYISIKDSLLKVTNDYIESKQNVNEYIMEITAEGEREIRDQEDWLSKLQLDNDLLVAKIKYCIYIKTIVVSQRGKFSE